MSVDLLPDIAQLRPQPLHGQGLEHVADDIVLDGLLGVLKIVIAAEKGNIGGRPNLPHLPGKLYSGDEGHPDVGQQQVRPVLLHQLEGIQPIAGASQQTKPMILPGDHGAYRLPELVLIVGDNHGVQRLCCHWGTCPFPQKSRRKPVVYTPRFSFALYYSR